MPNLSSMELTLLRNSRHGRPILMCSPGGLIRRSINGARQRMGRASIAVDALQRAIQSFSMTGASVASPATDRAVELGEYTRQGSPA